MNPGLAELIHKVGVLWRHYLSVPKLTVGTVASEAPLTIHLAGDFDDDGNPVATPADSLIGRLPAGSVVMCREQASRVTVIAGDARRVWARATVAPQSVGSSGTFSQLALTLDEADGVGFTSNTFTIQRDGLYLIEGAVRLPAASGNGSAAAYINGSLTGSPLLFRGGLNSSLSTVYRGSEPRPLNAGDEITFRMWQNSGSSLAPDPDYSHLSITRLGA